VIDDVVLRHAGRHADGLEIVTIEGEQRQHGFGNLRTVEEPTTG
jgi:hypothetical protein